MHLPWWKQITSLVAVWALVGIPVWAAQPPDGYSRPPIHVKGNATGGPTGKTPSQILHAYGFDQISNQGSGQTIAIVDAFDDPNIESDLGAFDTKFGLPACTTANGCFKKAFASGAKPNTNSGWALEISLDVEWAHAIAPAAKILLVEAASNSNSNLYQAVDYAVLEGANVVSMSWGGGESSGETASDSHFAVNHVIFTASSGDSGNGVEYPAASPYVVSVGGTTLNVSSQGVYQGETAWSGSGGGQSAFESEPSYQSGLPVPSDPAPGQRGVPDVAYDADPNTGFPVYDTVRYNGQRGWFQVGGTSAGAPQWAALFAIANSLRLSANKAGLSTASVLYVIAGSGYSTNYHDVTSGTNGTCGTLCTAAPGYDYVTGLGSPLGTNLIASLTNQP
jgi:subtilase family serine protease